MEASGFVRTRIRTKMTDPDPGGPKNFKAYGSGSGTLTINID
jgi:hypothetical protein